MKDDLKAEKPGRRRLMSSKSERQCHHRRKNYCQSDYKQCWV